jgi:hypothetical protein
MWRSYHIRLQLLNVSQPNLLGLASHRSNAGRVVVVSFDSNQPVRALATRRHDEILKRLGAQGPVRIGRCGNGRSPSTSALGLRLKCANAAATLDAAAVSLHIVRHEGRDI